MATKRPKPPAFHDPVTKADFEEFGRPLGITNESMARWLGYSDESGFRKTLIGKREQVNGKTVSVYRLDKPSGVLFRLLVARPELRAVLDAGSPVQVGKSDPELRTLLVLIDINGRNPDDWRKLKHTIADFKDQSVIKTLLDEGLIERRTTGRSLRSGHGEGEWFGVTGHARKRLFSAAVDAAFADLPKDKQRRFSDPVAVRYFLIGGDGKPVEDE
jgi:hypothetical protein